MMKQLVYILVFGFLMSCSNSRSYTDQDNQNYQQLKDVVNSRKLDIHSNFARPLATNSFSQVVNSGVLGTGNTASNIDISGNSNAFRIQGDSISGYFPYFGEIQFGGGYPGSNHQGIEFNDIPKDYSVTENDSKHSVEIKFGINDKFRSNEHYTVFITVFPSNRSTIQINSSNRTSIEYSGTLKQNTEEDKKTQ